MQWGPTEVAKLRELAALPDKFSAHEIAGYFAGVSRNAVIGTCRRNGIDLPRKGCNAPKTEYKKRQYVPRAKRRTPFVSPFVVDDSPLRCASVKPLHLSLLELERDSCRYPYGGDDDEPITFCGHPKHKGESYCREHFNLCRNNRPRLSQSADEIERRRRRMQHVRAAFEKTQAA